MPSRTTFGFIGFLGGPGTITVDGDGSSWTSSEDVFVGANGTLDVQNRGGVVAEKNMFIEGAVTLADGSLKSSGMTLNSGAFHFLGGTLTVGTFNGDLIQQGGTLAPGNTPGTTDVIGDYTIQAGGSVQLEIDSLGSDPGINFDRVSVTGTALLDGTLEIAIADGGSYSDPSARGTLDMFLLLTAGSRTGNFADVTYEGASLTPEFGPDENGSFRDHVGGGLFRSIDYTATEMRLTNLLGLPGDTDGDIDVDITDFNTLSASFDPTGANSSTNAWTTADFDNDGDVDITDFNALSSNFTPGGYGAGASVVPEPATCVLVATCRIGGSCGRPLWLHPKPLFCAIGCGEIENVQTNQNS